MGNVFGWTAAIEANNTNSDAAGVCLKAHHLRESGCLLKRIGRRRAGKHRSTALLASVWLAIQIAPVDAGEYGIKVAIWIAGCDLSGLCLGNTRISQPVLSARAGVVDPDRDLLQGKRPHGCSTTEPGPASKLHGGIGHDEI